MVLVDSPSCCYCKLNVPHGIISMERTWGRDTGMLQPGYHCCYTSHKMIAAMITKNAIRFKAPVSFFFTKNLIFLLSYKHSKTKWSNFLFRLTSAQRRTTLWSPLIWASLFTLEERSLDLRIAQNSCTIWARTSWRNFWKERAKNLFEISFEPSK